MDFLTSFRAARVAGTPLVAITTPDPGACIERALSTKTIHPNVPVVIWDACRGWRSGNPSKQDEANPGRDAIALGLNEADQAASVPIIDMLDQLAPRLPDKTILFLLNAHRYLTDSSTNGAAVMQGIWNLRDQFKATRRTLVLLGPSFVLPVELQGDVLQLDEPLPRDEALTAIVCGVVTSAGGKCTDAVRVAAVDALRGLASFPAEQATAMATDPKTGTLDVDELWERKRKMISSTPGLAVYRGGDTLDDVGGCAQVKKFLRMKAEGKQPFQAVVFIDEGEKSFAGATAGSSDSSGVSQGFLGTFLTRMQDWNDRGGTGMLFVGPPGAAKSMVAKATGATFNVPTIALDLGGMKASLVGESEARLRRALDVIEAVAERVLVIMTCNKVVALPPELKRRFKSGTFYFDLPDAREQEAIWGKYLAKLSLDPKAKRPPCVGWTGAEIRTACELSWDLGLDLTETPQFIVPVAKSAAEEIAALRRQADRRFLSASNPGVYIAPDGTEGDTSKRRQLASARDEV